MSMNREAPLVDGTGVVPSPPPVTAMADELMALLRTRTIRDLVVERAALGDKPFLVIDDDRTLTYAQAHHQSDRLAGALVDLGVSAGDVVACLMPNSVEQALAWFACAKLGAQWAPLNISLVSEDLSWTVNNTRARVFIVDERMLEAVKPVRGSLTDVTVTVLVGDPAVARANDMVPFEDLLAGGEVSLPEVEILPSTPTAITYSGGSTGRPKGIIIPNLYALTSAIRFQTITQGTPADVYHCFPQMFHAGGQFNGVIGPMYTGMTTHLSSWFSASTTMQRINDQGATVADPFGSIIMILLRQPESELDRSHAVRIGIGTGTGQIPYTSRCEFEERFNIPLHEVYGQTESGILSISERPGHRRAKTSGRPYGWHEVSIRDENDEALPVGEIGEIALRPVYPHTFMAGYLDNPTATAKTWANLWHHTSDIGRLDEDGYVYFLGRQAHWMRRRGENVSAYEVERVLLEHPAVVDAVVVGVPAEMGEEDLKAYLMVEGDGSNAFDFASVVEQCSANLAYFKVPRYYEVVDDVPRTATKGEPEREKLRARGIGNAWDSENRPAS